MFARWSGGIDSDLCVRETQNDRRLRSLGETSALRYEEASSPRRRQVEHWMPGVRRAAHLRAVLAAARPDRRHRPRHAARPAGDGLRGAGRAAGDHRPVHDGRLPGRLRPRRTVADPGPRPGLVARADDRRDDPAARRRAARSRRSPSPACSRSSSASITVGAGAAKLGFVADLLSNPVRTGYLAGLAVVIFVGQLPKLFGFSTDAERARRRGGGIRPGPRPDEPLGARHRPAQPRHHPRPQAGLAADARHPRRRRGRDRAVDRARPRARGVSVIGVLPQGFPLPAIPVVPVVRHPGAVRRGAGDLARRHRRHDLDIRRLRQRAAATR